MASEMLMKETLKSLCCSNGWCYGVIWGFDQTNSSLLILKDAYYEEQMGALIDSMLLQAHVVGRGIIGQAAFEKNHRWIDSNAHLERQNFVASFDNLDIFQEDSEFFCQFSMGIKTVAVISVEPWGVIELGSTRKNPEMKDFVDQTQQLFRGMNGISEIEAIGNQPHLYGHFFHPNMELDPLFVPSQPFSSIEQQIESNPLEQLLLESSNFFDCSATHQDFSHYRDCSVLTSSWPQKSKVLLSSQNLGSSISTEEFRAQKLSGLVTVEEFFMQKLDNVPTNSLQSSVTREMGAKKPILSNETLIRDRNGGSKMYNSSSLFSKLGLDHLLDGRSHETSRFSDQSSFTCKRRKISSQVKLEGPSFDGKMKPTEGNNVESNSEDSTKEARSCIDHDYGKTSEYEVAKTKKKKAKPGSRPRPKDRQMIQDRLQELRELIPNGDKMSIDRLLERTIRHLIFMQSLTRHAESLKQTAKKKSLEFQRNHSINGGDGVTWAYEVGEDAVVCPLIVEDLNAPGQMLIEILCEEQGFFLEIVEIIRGFGLTILKGEMEIRETKKICAHFMVQSEKTSCITRHEIFSALLQLLQMTGKTAVNEGDSRQNAIRPSMPDFSSFQHTSTPFSCNFADVLHCASL